MHDTAFHIGTLAMNIYADLRNASILEVGSQAVNGSLRENALPTTKYVGVDIEEAEGVDLVVEPGKPLPVDDDSFDFVMATSVFEHDPCFWMTFLEMCRTAKDGGYIYISAPSNGAVHRYPQDNWRFYPDSGKALAQWAISQGQPVTLVESFIAEREDDIWNDFVAVFRKGRITKALPKVFLHEHVGCSNIITWKSKAIINPRDEPQDLLLLRESKARAEAAEGFLEQATKEHDALVAESARRADELTVASELAQNRLTELESVKVRLAEAEDQLRARLADFEQLQARLGAAQGARDELKLRESELRQRQEEIEQTLRELAEVRSEREQLRAKLDEGYRSLELETSLRRQAESAIASWQGAFERAQAEREAMRDDLAKVRVACEVEGENRRTAESKLIELRQIHAREELLVSKLTDQLAAAEGRASEIEQQLATSEQRAKDFERRLNLHFGETAALSKMLLDREESARKEAAKVQWLREIHQAVARSSRWSGLLPRSRQRERRDERLRRLGLFDPDRYLQMNPDVAESGMDPLEHFVLHGIDEDRPH